MRKRRTPQRLLSILKPFGFQLGDVSPLGNSFAYTRKRTDQIYELISCSFAGKQNEAAMCDVGASVTRLVALKNLTEIALVLEVASDRERGWTILENIDQLKQWEDLVGKVAPSKANSFADDNAEKLLIRTENARLAVSESIELLLQSSRDDESIATLSRQASPEQVKVAERLLEWPGVQQTYDSEVYELACLAVATLVRPNNLPDINDRSEMPLENDALMWEIQLIADALLDRKQRLTT